MLTGQAIHLPWFCLFPLNGGLDYVPAGLFGTSGLGSEHAPLSTESQGAAFTSEDTPLSTLVLQVLRYSRSTLTSTKLVLRKFLNEFQNQTQVTLGLPQPGFNTPCLGSRVSSASSQTSTDTLPASLRVPPSSHTLSPWNVGLCRCLDVTPGETLVEFMLL